MHEISLCESVLRILQESAEAEGFNKIVVVYLGLGQLAGVELESIKFAFDVVVKGSIADGAKLVIEDIPGLAYCEKCHKNVPMLEPYSCCSVCASDELQVISGNELKINRVEVI